MTRFLLFGPALVALLALMAFSPAERPVDAVPSVQPSAVDTLRFDVAAGDPLIVALPARVNGAEATYTVEEAPALSWLVDRAFLYQTIAGERGTLAIRLRRTMGGQVTPVVLLVTVTA